MTNEDARKTVLPALKHRAREQLETIEWQDVETSEGFADLDINVSLGDYDAVLNRYGYEVANALFAHR
jgi:hypothetical protein